MVQRPGLWELHLHNTPRLGISGAMSEYLHTSLWRSQQILLLSLYYKVLSGSQLLATSKPPCSPKGKIKGKGKGKAVRLQAWRVPKGSWKLRFPDFVTTAQDSGKVVSLTHPPPLPPGNIPGTHFCLRLSRPQSHSAIGRILCQWKNSNDTSWDRTSDLPICSTLTTVILQSTPPPPLLV